MALGRCSWRFVRLLPGLGKLVLSTSGFLMVPCDLTFSRPRVRIRRPDRLFRGGRETADCHGGRGQPQGAPVGIAARHRAVSNARERIDVPRLSGWADAEHSRSAGSFPAETCERNAAARPPFAARPAAPAQSGSVARPTSPGTCSEFYRQVPQAAAHGLGLGDGHPSPTSITTSPRGAHRAVCTVGAQRRQLVSSLPKQRGGGGLAGFPFLDRGRRHA